MREGSGRDGKEPSLQSKQKNQDPGKPDPHV